MLFRCICLFVNASVFRFLELELSFTAYHFKYWYTNYGHPVMPFTARPKINSQSKIYRYGQSTFCLPHRPKISEFFDLCLHWVSVVRDWEQFFKGLTGCLNNLLLDPFTTLICSLFSTIIPDYQNSPLIRPHLATINSDVIFI